MNHSSEEEKDETAIAWNGKAQRETIHKKKKDK